MAVVQISRIQQRRGKKNTQTGFPQLASGEIGWAIDTQELYIGNGAVSEGAPYVGNTQVLTEHTNILDFASSYQYQRNNPVIQTGPTLQRPIRRSLQERLDERIDVRSFGVKGDGITDDTVAIQRAIDQTYLNDATKFNTTTRVILYFEPGDYIITEELKIPPYTYLSGAGIDSTRLILSGDAVTGPLMRTVDSQSSPGNYTPFENMNYDNRPRYILIERMTLRTTISDSVVLLDNADTCFFDQVKFVGNYVNGNSPVGEDPLEPIKQTAIYSRSTSGVFRPENVHFYSCVFNRTGYGMYSETDCNNLGFHDCKFYQLYDGFNIGGDVYGSVNTTINGCYFDLIDRHGIHVKLGYGNISSGNKFMLVGNNNQGYADAIYPIIRFDTSNNQSFNDYFERNAKLKDQYLFGLSPFEPCVKSKGLVSDPTNFVKIISETPINSVEFLRFPVYDSSTFFIDYVIVKNTNGSAVRTGQMHITIDHNALTYNIQDNFNYTGDVRVENITFSASIEDINDDGSHETLIIKMFNPSGNGTGTMNYSYRTMTQ